MEQHIDKCGICSKELPLTTNSHVIPSFLVAKVASVDHKSRDKEILYSIGKSSTEVYLGREVGDEERNRNFDELSDEQIQDIMKHDRLAEDFIFCESCERLLGKYLESPYARRLLDNQKVPSAVAFYFWLSVVWRFIHYESLDVNISAYYDQRMRKELNDFLQKCKTNPRYQDRSPSSIFKYRLLYAKDYCLSGNGIIYGEYYKSGNTFTAFLGDFVICVTFANPTLKRNYSFYGLEYILQSAPVNYGIEDEIWKEISPRQMDDALERLKVISQKNVIRGRKKFIIDSWKMLRRVHPHLNLPKLPSDTFVKDLLLKLFDKNVKEGVKTTREYYVKSYIECLKKHYLKLIS